MKTVDVYRWWVTARPGQREYLTNYYMDEATAKARYLTARPEKLYHRTQQVPQTQDDRNEMDRRNVQSAGKDGARKGMP